jgi:hypothetical protein
MLSEQQQQQQSFNDSYTALILEEAEKVYIKLITKFTNKVMAAAADIRASSLPVPGNNNKQKSHKTDKYIPNRKVEISDKTEIYSNIK